VAADVVRLTNAARAKKGCRPLKIDARPTRAARVHSMEMAKSGQFTHESPDGAWRWDRMARAGYVNGTAEHIGHGYSSAKEAVQSWLANRDHRRNMLNCDFNAVGVGVVSGPGGPWWTQDFGRSWPPSRECLRMGFPEEPQTAPDGTPRRSRRDPQPPTGPAFLPPAPLDPRGPPPPGPS